MQTGWARTILAITFLALAGCGGGRAAAPINSHSVSQIKPQPGRAIDPAALQHVVRRGDTLYSIAWEYNKDIAELAAWNGLRAPYTIVPGQRMRLTAPPRTVAAKPVSAPASAPREAARQPVAKAPPPAAPPRTVAQPAPKPAAQPAATAAPTAWRMPANGRLVRTFSASDPTRNGIDISGKLDDPVVATAPGRVVYSGNGLVGYGNLIIINHGGDFLSAYGHNRTLLVREGEVVKSGQLIARMGKADNGLPLLHFEIRKHGKPIDPMRLLPGS